MDNMFSATNAILSFIPTNFELINLLVQSLQYVFQGFLGNQFLWITYFLIVVHYTEG